MAGYIDNPDGVFCPYTGGNISGCFNQSSLQNMSGCFDYYLSRCFPYEPSDTCAFVSSDGGFSWAEAEAGFREAFPSLLAVFGVYCVIRVFRLVLW